MWKSWVVTYYIIITKVCNLNNNRRRCIEQYYTIYYTLYYIPSHNNNVLTWKGHESWYGVSISQTYSKYYVHNNSFYSYI
jgi:hypothetical protein